MRLENLAVRVLLAFLFLLCACVRAAEPAPARPNIVFILTDDHRWDGFGASGNREIVTPNIDALARDGIVFRHGTVGVPQCCPSRAAILTGQYPPANGYFSNKTWTRDAEKGFDAPTIAEVLQQAGYHTAVIGKWHIKPTPWRVGFDEVRVWMPQGADAYVDAKLAKGKSSKTREVEGHVTEIFSTDAVAFLREQSRTAQVKPFFLWLAYTAPHTPQKPVPQHCCDPYQALGRSHRPPGFPPDVERPGPWAQYYSAITHLDEQVGRVLKELKEGGLDENTLIVFLGDNGWMMGSHGRFGKNLPQDESTRVPFIVRAPRTLQKWSGTSEALVSSMDLAPTWADAAGASVEGFAGSTLLALLKDAKAPFRDYSLSLFEDEEEFPGFAFRMLRTKDFKYLLRPVRDPKDFKKLKKKLEETAEDKPETRKVPDFDHEQLFDLRSDPHELKNIAPFAGSSDILREMRAKMRAELIRTNDPAVKWLSGQPVKKFQRTSEGPE